MKIDRKQFISTLRNTYQEALEELSVGVGILPELEVDVEETTGKGDMYAAMIGIRNPGLRLTVSIFVDVPVLDGKFFQGYADKQGELLDDEISLFSEFADALTKDAVEKAGIENVSIPPSQIMCGENFRNIPSNKSAVQSFSLQFSLAEGRMFINASIHA